ncbi:MAG: HEAT repeat domain-containing protein [Planctomycetota bacterium]
MKQLYKILGYTVILFCFWVNVIYSADELSKIKQTLSDKSYANYWDRLDAINKLKKMDSKESAVILTALFNDDEAPIRESAVMALANLSNKEAFDYLVSNSLINTKSKQQRFYTAWSLGLIKSEAALDHLLKALNNEPAEEVVIKIIETISYLPNASLAEDALINMLSNNNAGIRASAIRTLGQINPSKAYSYLTKKIGDSNSTVKIAVLEALSAIKPKESIPYLEEALKDPLPEIRIVAIETLTKYSMDKMLVLKAASNLLSDKNQVVRISAVQSLKEIREKDSVRALIEHLPGASSRLRYDIIRALKDLTGQPFGFDSKTWLNWYEANKDKIEITPIKQPFDLKSLKGLSETIPTFFDIPILAKNIIFIIDFSGSMKYDAEGEANKGERKIDIALKELSETLKSLSAETKFNIIILSTEATRYNKRKVSKTMLSATDGNKKIALDFVKSLWDRLEDIKRGRGDHYDALIEALSEPEIDTIFLLSDGKPTYGTYIHNENIIENISAYNRFRKAVINTIMTGKKGTSRELMKKLAEISNGIYNER